MKKNKNTLNIVIVLVSLGIVSLCNMGYPLILKDLIDSALVSDFKLLQKAIGILLLILVISLSSELIHKVFRIKYIAKIRANLQKRFLNGILNMDFEKFSNKNSSEYVSMFNNDLNIVVENYYDEKINLYFSIFSSIVGIVALFSVNYLLAIIAIISSLFPLIIPMLFKKKLSEKRKKSLVKLEKLNLKLKDFLNGFDLINSFNLKKHIKSIFDKKVKETLEVNYKYSRLEAVMEIVIGVLSMTSNICLILVGTILIFNKTITAGALLAALQIADILIYPVLNISIQLNSINSTKSVKEDFDLILNTKENIIDKEININNVECISLENLSFSYGEKKVLSKINYTFEKNKKYAIVGESGSGKSTLLNIINRKYSNYDGNVLMNNYDIKQVNKKGYYKSISMLHQNTFIFNDTIINNITLFKKYKDAQVKEAIKKSCLDSLIKNKEDYNLESINDGNNISGGEKQKIAIARALLNNSNVLLLDEATSSLDNLNHIKVKEVLLNLKNTMIIDITHKLEPELLKKYDEILVINKGEIVESGSYNDLTNAKGILYNMMYKNSI